MTTKKVFKTTLIWRHGKTGVVHVEGRPEMGVATPPEFDGPEGYWSPEDMFLASVNSCIMTTFLYFAERFAVSFESYESGVSGEVELLGGKFAFTKIVVTPRIAIADESGMQKVQDAMSRSERYCLVSASVKTPIDVETQIVVGRNPK